MNEPAQLLIVVDREPAVHDLVARAVGSECAVLGATTAALAVQLAENRPPALALVEAAIGEPAAEDLLAELRERSPHMQAIFLATPAEGRSARLAALGAILSKPVDPDQLRELVRNNLRLKDISEGVDRLHRGASGTLPSSDIRRSAPTKRERPR